MPIEEYFQDLKDEVARSMIRLEEFESEVSALLLKWSKENAKEARRFSGILRKMGNEIPESEDGWSVPDDMGKMQEDGDEFVEQVVMMLDDLKSTHHAMLESIELSEADRAQVLENLREDDS
jgi:hypothetical protein